MDLTLDQKTSVGLGYSTHPDAFQRGREAAQVAKSQLADGPVDLVLIFGPGNVHFKDFIEGVRLVLGEDTLVAIPSERVFSSETNLSNTCFLAAMQTESMRISIATDDAEKNLMPCRTTSLISQFRSARGNTIHDFAQRGALVFAHHLTQDSLDFPDMMAGDMGLESWLIGGSTLSQSETPVFCTNRTMQHGIVAVEFLSMRPVGIGSVMTRSFSTQPDFHREALKAALRDALSQMQSQPACFGLVLFDFTSEAAASLSDDILVNVSSMLPQVPLIGVSTSEHFCRRVNRSTPAVGDSILVMLVPK